MTKLRSLFQPILFASLASVLALSVADAPARAQGFIERATGGAISTPKGSIRGLKTARCERPAAIAR